MNLLLDKYADNPIIDEVVYWPPENVTHLIINTRDLELEIQFKDRVSHLTPMSEHTFSFHLSEAVEILALVTNIPMSFIGKAPENTRNYVALRLELQKTKEELISKCMEMYSNTQEEPWLKVWLSEQFGYNYRDLPEFVENTLDDIRKST